MSGARASASGGFMTGTHSADVVVVGSGVAGALIAAGLAEAGVSVLVLEAGPPVDRAAAAVRAAAAALPMPHAAYADVDFAPRPRLDDLDAYYVQAGPHPFKGVYERVVGGTTWHWLGSCPRLLPADLRLLSAHGVRAPGVTDWPIGYDELEPWYAAAERELGVAGDADADGGSPRSGPYPLPPIPPSYLDRRVGAAVASLGLTVTPTPAARLSRPSGGRPACCGSATCVPVCPTGAKYDATVHLARAVRAGARVVSRAVVARLDADPTSGAITRLVVLRPGGTVETAAGRIVVVAAGGVESARLFLLSSLAARSGTVGRHLMDHPVKVSWGIAREPLYPYRGPLSTGSIDAFRDGPERAVRGGFRIELHNDGLSFAGRGPADGAERLVGRGLVGAALAAAVRDRAQRHLLLSSGVEQLPDPDNTITLDADRRDALGLPRPRVAHRVGAYAEAGLAAAAQAHDAILAAVGCVERHEIREPQGGGHLMGTLRMGVDPARSVAAPDGRVHDHPNLFVAGSSLFPTGGTANPTLTLAALALRTVPAIRAALRDC